MFRGTAIARNQFVISIWKRVFRFSLGSDVGLTTFRGINFFYDPTDIAISPSLVIGTYEDAEIDWMCNRYRNRRSEKILLVDVGANIGIYSLLFLSLSSDFKAIAIEPNIYARNLLLKNFQHNCVPGNRFSILCEALGNTQLKTRNFVLDSNAGASSFSRDGESGVPIPVRSLQSLSPSLKQDYAEIFIKIDVEGFEHEVIASGLNLIRNSPITLMFEFQASRSRHLEEIYAGIFDFLAQIYSECLVFDDVESIKLSSESVVEALFSSRGLLNIVYPNEFRLK